MPKDKGFKRLIRDRMRQTGARYTQVLAELRRSDHLSSRAGPPGGGSAPSELVEATAGLRSRELFVVDGASAAASALRARDPMSQTVLALAGRLQNVERSVAGEAPLDSDAEALVAAVGGGSGAGFDLSTVPYHKVILLLDTDSAGSHSRVLLLAFLFRQMRGLVEDGRVFLAVPPRFVALGGEEKVFLDDDTARDQFLGDGPREGFSLRRLRGLGEMDWQELWSTTMNPATRRLQQVNLEEAAAAGEAVSRLMGDDAELRRQFISAHADGVRFVDT